MTALKLLAKTAKRWLAKHERLIGGPAGGPLLSGPAYFLLAAAILLFGMNPPDWR